MADAEWNVERHLLGKPPEVVALYHHFTRLVSACGPFTYSVSKSAITFKGARRGFAGARLRRRALGGYLDLQRRVDDPRITSSSPYTSRLYVHQFRIDDCQPARRRVRRLDSRGLPGRRRGASVRHRDTR
jgi:hypothetical protein